MADFVIAVNKDLTPLPLSIQKHHFLFGCSENIVRQYENSLSRSTFSWMSEDTGEKKREGK